MILLRNGCSPQRKYAIRSIPILRSSATVNNKQKMGDGSQPDYMNFPESPKDHPLGIKRSKELPHHIWSEKEVNTRTKLLLRHKPQSFSDYAMKYIMIGLYHSFNLLSGYTVDNPTVNAMEKRLLILESIAAVPAFVAASFRHFRCFAI
jgi:hypothetical protein